MATKPAKKAPPPAKKTTDETTEEQSSDVVTVEFLGKKYSVPRDRDDWPWQAHVHFDDGEIAEAVRALIGDQWPTLFRDGALTRREYREFATLLRDTVNRECVG